MAWNEPGGGNQGGKDPWGNRDEQGPPDLDEAFRKLQNNLAEMFGGKKSGSGGSGGRGSGFSAGMFGIGAVILVVIWAGLGVYQVDQQEQGVVLRFGAEVPGGPIQPGLHWNPPLIDQVLVENVTQVRDIPVTSEMLTKDENIVKVIMTVQYVINDVSLYLLRVRNPDTSLQHAMESALRHEVGSAEMNDVLTEGRAALGDKIRARIQTYMENYDTGIFVTQVNIDETAPPDLVKAAFDDVIKAREDEVRVINEANAYKNQVIPEARGQAKRLLEEAEGYKQRIISEATGEADRFNKLYVQYALAPEVTRDRIYIDTMEAVMSSSTKVMIDVEGGNNLLYLPLDKLMESSGAGSRSSSFTNSSPSAVERNEAGRRSNRRDRN